MALIHSTIERDRANARMCFVRPGDCFIGWDGEQFTDDVKRWEKFDDMEGLVDAWIGLSARDIDVDVAMVWTYVAQHSNGPYQGKWVVLVAVDVFDGFGVE